MQSAFEVRLAAENYFASGLFCAESVVLALAKAQGIESDLVPKMATGFCSGMARTCGTCGALTGAIIGLGFGLGRSNADGSVRDAYTATERLVEEFEQAFGARDCQTLLSADLGSPKGEAAYRSQSLGERCEEYTGKAAEIAATILAERGSLPV